MVRVLHRSPLRPTITHEGDGFVVRFLDAKGRRREQSFRTKREARFFAHQFAKPEPSYDPELAWLNTENVGCFARNIGPAVDAYRHEDTRH